MSEEEREERKDRHLFVKLICFILSVICIIFTAYSLISLFVKDIDKSPKAYIALNGKSVSETKQVLSQYGKDKQEAINDYAVLGNKLYISENKITPKDIRDETFISTSNGDFAIYDMGQREPTSIRSDISNKKCYLNLSSLENGNYFIYSDKNSQKLTSTTPTYDFNLYSIRSFDPIDISFYTLPDSKKERKKITLKNNPISPFTMIDVRSAGSILKEDEYDLVLLSCEDSSSEKSMNDKDLGDLAKEIQANYSLKVKACYSLQDAIDTSATYSIAIDQDATKIVSSVYNYNEVFSFQVEDESSRLAGYDFIPEIRELTGYLDMAGKSYKDVERNDTKQSGKRLSKESYVCSKSQLKALISSLT